MGEKELAKSALEHFTNHSYDKCVDALHKLNQQERLQDDTKVQHNLALANYYLSNFTEPKKFLEELVKIKKKIEEAVAEQNKEAAASASGNNSTASSNVSQTAVRVEEFDTYLVAYNQAVIHYQMKQFAAALTILEPLLQHTAPLDEQLAIKICILLLEIQLNFKQKEKAAASISYLEKACAHSSSEFIKETENESSEEKPLSVSRISPVTPISKNELSYHTHILKSRLHLLNKDFEAAKESLKIAISNNAAGTAVTTLLKAHIEYLKHNFSKSLKLLNRLSKVTDANFPLVYFNNLGCIHFWMKKYSAASFYFSKALKYNEQLFEAPEPRKLSNFAKSKKMEIMYNIGYQLLLLGNPEQAFQCFQECALLFHRHAKLWLRIAECCIAHHVKKLHESKKNKVSIVRKVAGYGESRRVILPAAKAAKQKEDHFEGTASEDNNNVQPASVIFSSISLEFGAKAAKNCLFLLSRTSMPPPSTANTSSSPSLTSSASTPTPSAPIVLSDDDLQVQAAALLALAYISLCLNNPVVALSSARELLNNKKCTETQRYLGNIYAAEALCMMGKPAEAAEHLSPSTLGLTDSSNMALPSSSYSSFYPESSLNLRYTLFVNLAIVHILKDDLAQAQTYLNQAVAESKTSTAALLQVYLELRKGNTESALRLLKTGTFAPSAKPGE